jgi:hypothetical protein
MAEEAQLRGFQSSNQESVTHRRQGIKKVQVTFMLGLLRLVVEQNVQPSENLPGRRRMSDSQAGLTLHQQGGCLNAPFGRWRNDKR